MESKVNISSLSGSLSLITGKSRKFCEDFLREFFRLASETLQEGENLKIKGLGTFKISEVESRVSVNINTGEKTRLEAYKKVVFTPSKELAAQINAPFEAFETVEMEDELPDEIFLEVPEEENEDVPEEENKEDFREEEIGEKEEELSDEDRVSEYRLEDGSDEEGEDDDITYKAYTTIEEEKEKEEIPWETFVNTQPPQEQVTPEEAPLIPTPTQEYYYETPSKSRFGIGFLIGALSTFAVCVVIFVIGCFCDWWPVNFGSAKKFEKEAAELAVSAPETPEPESDQVAVEEEPPVYDTVTTTRYLTTIAREHYGNFNFWPYIYMENESILGHPDRITPGTQVVVPKLSKYGVDPANKEDVEQAKKKAAEIYSRYK